jgi:TrmH family RNA methyltransferase
MPADSGLIETVRRLEVRSERDRLGLFKIERFGAFVRAVDCGAEAVGVIACWKLITSQIVQTQVRRLRRSGVPTVIVDPPTFRGLHGAMRASGVIGVFRQRWTPLSDAPPGTWLALDRIRSLGNLGCILRTAEAAGISGVVLVGDAIDPFDRDVVGSAMGGLTGLSLVRGSAPDVRSWARARGFATFATSPSAPVPWEE